MGKAAYHMATVTLKLPFEITHDAELAALRAAGIPVDDQGVAESGFLHMRTTSDYRSHVFRWFASGGPAGGLGRIGRTDNGRNSWRLKGISITYAAWQDNLPSGQAATGQSEV
jgi:hypothetical protein